MLDAFGPAGRDRPPDTRIASDLDYDRPDVGTRGPAVFKDALYSDVGRPLPGEGPDGPSPSKIHGLGPASVRIQWAIYFLFWF